MTNHESFKTRKNGIYHSGEEVYNEECISHNRRWNKRMRRGPGKEEQGARNFRNYTIFKQTRKKSPYKGKDRLRLKLGKKKRG